MTTEPLLRVGWREWVSLPELNIDEIKVKVDTGARSSSLHAYDIEIVHRHGTAWVQFKVHPVQKVTEPMVRCRAPLLEHRWVKSSNGKREFRPVIHSALTLAGRTWDIEVTLASRDEMGFRMLLGREALRRRAIVDPGRSFLASAEVEERKRAKKKPKRKKVATLTEEPHLGRGRRHDGG